MADEQYKSAPLPVPTPNPGAGSGSGLPTAVSYNTSTNSWTDQPSWDYERFGPSPAVAAQNPTAISNLNTNINNATGVTTTSSPTNTTSNTGLTADILRSRFGLNDSNVIAGILADPTKKAQYERELSGNDGGSDSPTPPSSKERAASKYKEITGEDPTTDLLEKWKNQGSDLERLAEENARLDMQNAENEYNAVMSALSGQKEYVKGSAETQRSRSMTRGEELKAEADIQSGRDQEKIQSEKTKYEASYEGDKSMLAQNWKDLSRYTQALSRASGRQDSSFGDYQETKQLMDFNKGLRVLATENSETLGEFGRAVSDTLDFYRREKQTINQTTNDTLAKIDDWEKAQITAIQGQEGVSLAKKLSDINNATKTANGLKMQIQSNINDKISALDTFLLQTKINFQNQVALLAKSSSGAASVKSTMETIKQGLATGVLAYRKVPIWGEGPQAGTNIVTGETGQIYGSLPGYENGVNVPIETVNNFEEDRANKVDELQNLLRGAIAS